MKNIIKYLDVRVRGHSRFLRRRRRSPARRAVRSIRPRPSPSATVRCGPGAGGLASYGRWRFCGASVGHLSIAPPSNTQVEERVRFILHQKLGKPHRDSLNTTTTPASLARVHVEERPDTRARSPRRCLVRRELVRRGLLRRYRPDHHREAWCRDAWCGGARRLHSGPAGWRGLDRCAEEAQKTCEPATPRVRRLV